MPKEQPRRNWTAIHIQRLRSGFKKMLSRQAAANLMMVSFILFTTIGCFLVYAPAGFISAGLTCGLFGFLLGQE